MKKILAALLMIVSAIYAQPAKSIVGKVTGFRPETAEVEVTPANGAAVTGRFSADTIALRVAPGETDLKKAATIQVTDVALGDSVLLTFETGATNVRRILVMPATDIAKHNETDRLDWQKRGITGIVEKKNGNEVILKVKVAGADAHASVTITDATSFKRYAPDSVKFSDAQSSRVAEVSMGDQLRARGQKSEDGLKVAAEDVVFGTFLTTAGAIVAIDAETHEITLKELRTGKTLLVKLTPDSQLKKMPDMTAMMSAMGGRRPDAVAGATRPAGASAMSGRGAPDISQMLDRMPPAKMDDLKPGETIVVSSTKGARNDELTAITLLGNAGMLIQMAAAASGGGTSSGGMGRGGMGGMMGGGGMDMGSMMPGIIP